MTLSVTYTTATGSVLISFETTDTSQAGIGSFATAAEFQRAAIQYALDQAVPNSGATQSAVTLSAGIFSVAPAAGSGASAGCLIVHSNTVLGGQGASTSIELASTDGHAVTGIIRTASGVVQSDGSISTTSNVTIQNLTIDGNKDEVGTTDNVDGFYCGPSPESSLYHDSNITVASVTVLDCSRYGFDPHATTTGLAFTDCTATNNYDGFTIDGCGLAGAGNGVTITNCTATGNDRYGFNIVTGSSNVIMSGDIASGNGTAGIIVQTGDNEAREPTHDVTIVGCTIQGNAGEGIILRQVAGVTIGTGAVGDRNTITGNQGVGILIEGSQDVVVTNNVVTGNVTIPNTGGSDSEIYINGYLQDFFAPTIAVPTDPDPADDMFLRSSNVIVTGNTIGAGAEDTASRGITWNIADVAAPATSYLTNTFAGFPSTDNVMTNSTSQQGAAPLYSYVITSGADTVAGTAGHDVIAAGAGNDTISGLAGDDILYGNDGNDTLAGGIGSDALRGGTGSDTASYAASSAGVTVTVNGSASGGDAQGDTLFSIENLIGSAFGDVLTGNDGANQLDGGAGADALYGGLGNDTYVVDNIGDAAIDVAGGGVDVVKSSVTYTLGADIENLTLTGAAVANGTGNALDNILTGNSAANALYGGNGNDTLDGAAGADTMTGGAGNDTYYVNVPGDSVVEGASAGTDTIITSLFDYSLAALANVENLTATAYNPNSFLSNFTGNAAANVITINDTDPNSTANWAVSGMGGNDTIYGGLYGLNQLDGGDGSDVLYGGALVNYLDGGLGADTMYGGTAVSAENFFFVDNVADAVYGGAGFDIVQSALTTYTLGANIDSLEFLGAAAVTGTGNALDNSITAFGGGNDLLRGMAGNDGLGGEAGNDTLDGGLGIDSMYGGLGNDAYVVENAGDVVSENANEGTDVVQSSISYALGANLENLTLTSANAINGTGNAVANTLIGNSAANVITGGAGADWLHGAGGADTFDFNLISETTVAARDVINDFVHLTDKMDLSGIDANNTIAGNQAFSFLATKGAAFGNIAGQLHYLASGANTLVEGDVNGDAVADFQILLNGALTLTSPDFIL